MVEHTDIPGQPTITIESELKKSYLDYAMSVIIGRALPDVRDGLKPVHRRALYAMRELNNYHNRPYLKSARIVGDVIGKYHPHGDTAAYDTIVRMAQDFSLRYLLVDGQGNFGSVDGDSPAAMRYTEARMTKLDQELIADLDKETVDFVPTYDNSHLEPVVFPTKVPNLLINGSSGIAVGMATNIPPHNLTEVMNGLLALIDNPDITVSQLMEIITGPDFPTGAYICGRAGIREAYETGRGSVLMRSKTHVEKSKKANRESIIISEIPYQQNKASLVEKIAILIKEKKIEAISEIRDESDRHGMRVVLELKKDEIAEVVLNQLYKMTPLQRSFGIILLSIVNGRPEVLNLKEILDNFLLHRKTVVYRRTVYDLRKTEEKAHVLEGLKIAITNLDEVVELIKKSPGPKEAKQGLIERFELSEIQAQAILDMRLQRLTGLERDKIIEEYTELMRQIEWFKKILADQDLVMKIIRDEFIEIRDTYGDERRTELIEAPDEILPEDMITPEEMVVTVTHDGYIKRNHTDLYRAQRRGGKGIKGIQTHRGGFRHQPLPGHHPRHLPVLHQPRQGLLAPGLRDSPGQPDRPGQGPGQPAGSGPRRKGGGDPAGQDLQARGGRPPVRADGDQEGRGQENGALRVRPAPAARQDRPDHPRGRRDHLGGADQRQRRHHALLQQRHVGALQRGAGPRHGPAGLRGARHHPESRRHRGRGRGGGEGRRAPGNRWRRRGGTGGTAGRRQIDPDRDRKRLRQAHGGGRVSDPQPGRQGGLHHQDQRTQRSGGRCPAGQQRR
jgi:DNA gyrase/topoisomerase IV subunit A